MWRQTLSGDALMTKGVEKMRADVVDEVAGECDVAKGRSRRQRSDDKRKG
jgi:hypothetical protein